MFLRGTACVLYTRLRITDATLTRLVRTNTVCEVVVVRA